MSRLAATDVPADFSSTFPFELVQEEFFSQGPHLLAKGCSTTCNAELAVLVIQTRFLSYSDS